MLRGSDAEVNVISLVGERGRELKEFVEQDLGPEGLARSVIVVSTSDQPAPMRIRASILATAISEGFRNEGRKVLLLMDFDSFCHGSTRNWSGNRRTSGL